MRTRSQQRPYKKPMNLGMIKEGANKQLKTNKNMKVTKSNIHFVAHLLKKCLTNGFVIQTYYPTAKKQNSILKHFNIENNWSDFLYRIENSDKANFRKAVIEIDNKHHRYNYIRIHNDGETSSDFMDYDFNDNSYMAMIIHIGDKITFNKGRIVICKKHFLSNENILEIINYK